MPKQQRGLLVGRSSLARARHEAGEGRGAGERRCPAPSGASQGKQGSESPAHPALQPGPSAPAHAAGSPPRSGTSAAPRRWKHPAPTYRQGPPRGRRSSAKPFGAGGELPRRTGCSPSQLVQNVLFRLSALPLRASSSSRGVPKVGGERAAAKVSAAASLGSEK